MKEQVSYELNKDKKKMLNEIIRLLKENSLTECEELLEIAIGKYPHDPEPHNLFGIFFEKKSDHNMAMKHFRAAWDLDPTYLPARHNLEHYGTFFSRGQCAYDESDCIENEDSSKYQLVYNENNIGHIVRRKKHER